MLKAALCLILMAAICLSPAGCAMTGERFAFMDAITWDSTPEEAASVLGDSATRAEETDGALLSLSLEDVPYAGYSCDKMVLMFYDNALFTIICYYTESALTDAQALIDSLTKIYGVPEMRDYSAVSLEDYFARTKTKCTWSMYEDTEIAVVQPTSADAPTAFSIEESSPYLCWVSFTNLPVLARVEEAVSSF